MNPSFLETDKSEKTAGADTPMLRQYRAIKAEHPDGILLFRLGDFYEMFYEDAETASRILDVVLTARGKGTAAQVPMCGFPYHAADSYIAKLVKAGYKAAICEQLEDPAQAKGVVKRGITRIVTAGTFIDENTVDSRRIACIVADEKTAGLAFMDPAEGTIHVHFLPNDPSRIQEFFQRWNFDECLVPEKQRDRFQPLLKAEGRQLTAVEDWRFNPDIAHKNLCDHFRTVNLHGFDLEGRPLLTAAASALLQYLQNMNRKPMRHIDRISRFSDGDYAVISAAAVRGLEMDSMIRTLDMTQTPMGRRMFRFWMTHPLIKPADIRSRQDVVERLKNSPSTLKQLQTLLSRAPDMEKHLSRISAGYTHAKDLVALLNAMTLVPPLQDILRGIDPESSLPLLTVEDIVFLRGHLEVVINPDVPLGKPDGKILNPGVNKELDKLRDVRDNGQEFLRQHQAEEIKRTGISSLKISFNKIFGYYIEITKANLHAVPPEYIRKQTLVNAERFVTPKLGEYEQMILTAEEKIVEIERRYVIETVKVILDHADDINRVARQIAAIDCLSGLAALAISPGYVRPDVNDRSLIDIRQGRHPAVERRLSETFIANDTLLDDANRLIILTGPNMAGKSTFIRQTALLVILAQTGSFIPAESAVIGVADRIFTRIGAHDDISRGQSTFMVEMNEAAHILNNLTPRSLVILDEIGRGTSTYDGLSLAWALAEHLHSAKARSLFATHFHELIALAEISRGIKNYNVAVKEWDEEIIFLHKIIPGGADDSYGIYVAKLAGVPAGVISRAKEILTKMELKDNAGAVNDAKETQLSFFVKDSPSMEDRKTLEKIRGQLNKVDLNETTPLQALKILEQIKKII